MNARNEGLAREVQRLWSVHEIQQLAYRYAFAFDSRDVYALHALWAETETRAEYPDINIHTVHEEFDQWLQIGPTILFVGNHIIDFEDEDHARGVVYCLAQIDLGDTFVDQSVLYQDRYVRHDGRWLFETRRHELWFGVERDRNPMHQPPADWPQNVFGKGTVPESLPSYRQFRGLD